VTSSRSFSVSARFENSPVSSTKSVSLNPRPEEQRSGFLLSLRYLRRSLPNDFSRSWAKGAATRV
jgi:hypothetical protein